MTAHQIIQASAAEAEAISRERLAADDFRNRERLIHAIANRYYRDPKLAYGLITGACTWPPVNDETCAELAEAALSLVDDCEDWETVKIDQLYAAERAFLWIAEEEAREASEMRETERYLRSPARYL